jgi:hypothetical protein
VKVLMKRVPSPGAWREMNEVLRELRMLAMTQPGYISGETLLSAADQGTTMVVSPGPLSTTGGTMRTYLNRRRCWTGWNRC